MFYPFRLLKLAIVLAGWFAFFTGISAAEGVRVPSKSKALAHYIMGVVDNLNGDDEKAMQEYQQSLRFDRSQPIVHLRVGSYYARQGRLPEATRELKIVVKLAPQVTPAHYLLALIYSAQKKYELAASEYEAVLKKASDDEPQNTEVHAYLAQLYYALHKYPLAIEQLHDIIKADPKNASAYYLLGTVHLELDHRQEAKEALRQVLALDSKHDGALNSLAYMYAEEGVNLDEALRMVQKAIDLAPANGAYFDTLGWVLFKQGLKAEALMALQKAATYLEDPTIYDHIGDVYQALDEPTQARQSWMKSLQLDQKQPKVSQKLENLNHRSASSRSIP